MVDRKIQNAIIDVLKRYPIKLAYLYGSYAKNTAGPQSDVDIAVVPEEAARVDELRLAADVDRAVPGVEINTVVIGPGKSPLLTFNVIRLEQPIYVKNEPDRVAFETHVIKQHFDNERLYLIKQQYRDQAFS